MLTIDHHVQSTLYKFNREMKHLNQGEGQVPCQAGQPSKDGPEVASADGLRFVVPVRTIHAGPQIRSISAMSVGVTYYKKKKKKKKKKKRPRLGRAIARRPQLGQQ